jgi:hypothetical protein
MKRLFSAALTAASSRAVPPLVVGFFFLLYIGIAFFTDETLITLMAFTRKSYLLAALLGLIPLNYALRMLQETVRHLGIRRAMTGKTAPVMAELFDETVELPASTAFPKLQDRLAAAGYKTRRTEERLIAWRGVSNFPVRLLFLAGTFSLFAGILISITTRTSHRQMVIEGEQFPTPTGIGGTVERISLAQASGRILSRTLTMDVAPSHAGYGRRSFGLYPPALYGGYFVYPRYLGLALLLRFSAPDLTVGIETPCTLNCFPPGKEDSVAVPGSPYTIVFSLPEPAAGSDRYLSYMTDKKILRFKVLKGKELLFTGSAPVGGEYVHDGYRLALPDARRLVVTDFIGDYGVLFIWAAALFLLIAGTFWLPLRAFFPRREMVFIAESGVTRACSRTEGGTRRHAGVFHEALDLIAAKTASAGESGQPSRV